MTNLLGVAQRFNLGKATQAALATAQDEFNMACARANKEKKDSDIQNKETPWAPIVQSTSLTTTGVTSAISILTNVTTVQNGHEKTFFKESLAVQKETLEVLKNLQTVSALSGQGMARYRLTPG